jgi:hypothetical protein
MSTNVTDWVVDKLATPGGLVIVERTPENFLLVRSRNDYTFVVGVLGVQGVIGLSAVDPLFNGTVKPQLVVNVPSKSLWSGAAIDRIHAESASFGTFGDISRAADTGNAGFYREKNMGFFINAMQQHGNVSNVSYVYETVVKADLKIGASVVVAVIETYNMSAEDVRNARARLGHFDVVVKSSSYGSITDQAEAAAKSMGAQALTFRQLMERLAN